MVKLYKNTEDGLKLVDFGLASKKYLYVRQGYIVKMYHEDSPFKEQVWRHGTPQPTAKRKIVVTHRMPKKSIFARIKEFAQSLVPQPAFAYNF